MTVTDDLASRSSAPRDDPPSPAELEFMAMLPKPNARAVPRAYAGWASEVRERWEREQVLWFHGFKNGKAVWLSERPPTEE